jgi:dTDP-glucose 4,6-dehydratase
MKILVTGGAGFIGSNFVTRTMSTKVGIEVAVLDSLTYAGSLENLERQVDASKFIEGDIRDAALVDDLIAKCDLVVNFAAESHNDNSLVGPDIFFETNVMGLLNIANSCVRHDVRLHHVSTDEVFGDLALDSVQSFDLETPYNPSSPYSASKAAGDHLVRAWIRSFGLRATISNCSNNYGPKQHWEKLIPSTIRSVLRGEKAKVYGSGLNVRDWIHVDDHIDGIWLAIDRGAVGSTYLFGARNTCSNLEIVSSILKEFDLGDDSIEFVQDRPGHDLKYAIDPSFSERELGWVTKRGDVLQELSALIPWYAEKLS